MALGLALLVAVPAGAAVLQSRAEELLRTGRRVSGRLVDVRKNDIVIAYEAQGRSRRATIKVGEEASEYHLDQSVELLYDPVDPERVRTRRDSNQPVWVVLALGSAGVGAAAMAFLGGRGLTRARRFRRILATVPWRAASYRYMDLGGESSEPVVAMQAGDRRVMLAVNRSDHWRRASIEAGHWQTLWVAGDPTRPVVLSLPGAARLLAGQPAWRPWGQRRWARQMEALGERWPSPSADSEGPEPPTGGARRPR